IVDVKGPNAGTGTNQHRVQHAFKVVLLGAPAVGKTSLIGWYVRGEFKERRAATHFADCIARTTFLDDSVLKLEVWDTPGADRYRSHAFLYYTRCHGSIVVYDMTAPDTYRWAQAMCREIVVKSTHNPIIALVGNKADLVSGRAVESREVEAYARNNSLIFMEVSAKAGRNLNTVLAAMAKLLPECD
ncbi:unnamed protein product, partial [Medioppia subpectinata]